MMNQFATLHVVAVERIGAFLDWGQEKDLFLPNSEQIFDVLIDDKVFVYIHLDYRDRPCASMKIDKFVKNENIDYKIEQKVDLIILDKTDLGYKALINKKHIGVIFHNEVFKPLHHADELTGYIAKIREGGKIDLILEAFGNKGSGDLGEKILEVLKENGGFLAINDKTPPEKIYDLFGVSKKKYKMALGGIYKKRLVIIDDNGLRLVKK